MTTYQQASADAACDRAAGSSRVRAKPLPDNAYQELRVVGPALLLHLQRSVGNAAATAAVVEARRRDHQLSRANQPQPASDVTEPFGGAGLTAAHPSPAPTSPPVVQRGKGEIARKAVGWIVTVGERKLIKRAAVYTEKEMAKLLGKGYNVLVKRGFQQAKRVAKKVWGDGYMHHTGHWIRKAGKLGESHFQPVKQLARQQARAQVEKGWHIFYSAAPVLFLSESAEAMAIYEDKYPGQSVAHYLTVTKYVGKDSWLSYIDYVNPAELVAIGGDIGRNWDRERTKELRALVFNQVGRDGSVQTYEMDPEGVLLRVIVKSKTGEVKEMTAEDFFIFLAEHAEAPITLPESDGRKSKHYGGDIDPEYRLYASSHQNDAWVWEQETLSLFLPAGDASKLVKVGDFWTLSDFSTYYLSIIVHPSHRHALGAPAFTVPKAMILEYLSHTRKDTYLQELLEDRLNMVELSNLPLGSTK